MEPEIIELFYIFGKGVGICSSVAFIGTNLVDFIKPLEKPYRKLIDKIGKEELEKRVKKMYSNFGYYLTMPGRRLGYCVSDMIYKKKEEK